MTEVACGKCLYKFDDVAEHRCPTLRERCQKLVLDLQTSEWLNTVAMYDRVQMIESFALQIRSEALEEAALLTSHWDTSYYEEDIKAAVLVDTIGPAIRALKTDALAASDKED